MTGKILALCGGIGGAKLVLGLSHVLAPENLTIMVNTGDDFEHLGLHISPDIDTVLYTLADINNKELGWGPAGETWNCMSSLETLGGETWFRLGDKDLATHLRRTERLKSGDSLTRVTKSLCESLGIRQTIVPMTDAPVRTIVKTERAELAFQHYFVRERCQPEVMGFYFDGIDDATPNSAVLSLLRDSELAGIIICPSNPFVSIDPILRLPGFEKALAEAAAPVVAISPIVGGLAIKGPIVKMMAEMAIPSTPTAICDHYGDLLNGFIFDIADREFITELQKCGIALKMLDTVMRSLDDKIVLAQNTLEFLTAIKV